MPLHALIERLSTLEMERHLRLLDGLGVVRSPEPYGFEASVYEPVACLILQGAKETVLGESRYLVNEGQCIVVSHALPVTARVTVARPDRPYLCLVAPLDLALLRSLDHEVADDFDAGGAAAFVVHEADAATLDVFSRFAALADDPADARVLGPAVRRELHYRLLRSASGAMLRSLLQRGSHASQVAQAIDQLRHGFRQRVEMEELARSVGMSSSSFYRHFKQITSTTPLQFQKDLRLTEARRLLQRGEHSVSSAAFTVGYESPSQFSREYSRKFGAPPRDALSAAHAPMG